MATLCNVRIISFELITLMIFDEEFEFPLSVEVCLVTQAFSGNAIYTQKELCCTLFTYAVNGQIA
jgi:hypothetical protein